MASLQKGYLKNVPLLFVASVLCVIGVRLSLACKCVPENLCPAPDVDLRLGDETDKTCSLGMVCCSLSNDDPNGASCGDGVCVADRSMCSGEDYEEYGVGLIDIRTDYDNDCPGTQYCCRTKTEKLPAICDGTCVPKSLCSMFQSDGAGCSVGNVCCRMDRESWMEVINDINDMVESKPTNAPQRECKWSRLQNDTTVVPPWLVSVWARVAIIPGIQSDQFICGGVLVNPSLILTTASCVKDVPAQEMFVNIGDYDISSRSSLRGENVYTISEKILHEYYNSSDPVHNDVALLRLTAPLSYGQCDAPLASPPANRCKAHNQDCFTIGWNRTLLATGFGRPNRLPVKVTTFQEDLFCAPGTICIDREEGHCVHDGSLDDAVIICEEGELQEDWKVRGLLIRNCTGVAIESVSAWLEHQRNPGFVQKPAPTIPSRQYLPVI